MKRSQLRNRNIQGGAGAARRAAPSVVRQLRQLIAVWAGRVLPVLMVAACGTVISWLIYQEAVERGQAEERALYEAAVEDFTRRLQGELTLRSLVPTTFAGLLAARPQIEAGEFQLFAEHVFQPSPSLTGVAWIPLTRPAAIPAMTAAAIAEGLPFALRDADGPIDPTTLDRDTLPIRLAEPVAGNKAIFGLDMLALPEQREVVETARDTGGAVATPPIDLFADPARRGVVLFAPVYGIGSRPASVPSRREAFLGVTSAAFDIAALLTTPFGRSPALFHAHIYDRAAEPAFAHLLTWPASGLRAQPVPPEAWEASWNVRDVVFGQRAWTAGFEPVPQPHQAFDRALLILAVGLALTGIVMGGVWYFSDRAYRSQRHAQHLDLLLQEKEILIREVNHRVKNSLQLVQSLLRMYQRRTQDSEAQALLEDAGARVGAIARIHERLYRGERAQTVDFDVYLRAICDDTRAAIQEGARDLEIRTTPLQLSTDRAVSLGLIAVELITNAVKHGSDDQGQPRVSIELLRPDANRARLVVRDFGHGPGDRLGSAEASPSGTGTMLIQALARQAGVTLHVEDAAPGTRWRADFELSD